MHLSDRESDQTHLNALLAQNLMLIPNLKTDFQKNLKKSQNIAKTKKQDFRTGSSNLVRKHSNKNFLFNKSS